MSTSPTSRPPPYFIGDHLALDFLNSTAAPHGERIEWLRDGLDLLSWLESAGAIGPQVASRIRAENYTPRALDTVAEQARGLREWLRGFVVGHAGAPLDAGSMGELEPLNRLLARDQSFRQIEATRVAGSRKNGTPVPALSWRQERRWTAPESLLQPVAEAIGDLVCYGDFRLVRNCEGPTCTLMFFDRTKAHARRWCSMAVCGNRSKAAAHRAKHRQMHVHP